MQPAEVAAADRADGIELIVLQRGQGMPGSVRVGAEIKQPPPVLVDAPRAFALPHRQAVAVDRPRRQADERSPRGTAVGEEEAELRLADLADLRAAELLQGLHQGPGLAFRRTEVPERHLVGGELPAAA